MKDQIDVLKELQERVLIKGGVCAFAGMQDFVRNEAKIAELEAQLDLQCVTIYRRLAKKGPVFVASVSGGVCAGCGMSVPSAVQQAARLGETLVMCPHCSRILYDDREDAVRGTNGGRRTATKSTATLARFSDEELVAPDLAGSTPEAVIAELAMPMQRRGFIEDAETLVAAALRREALMPTAMENGIAWPHVRMEGGPLTVAIGRSRLGFDWHGRKVRYVFLAAIPVASSGFYAKLMAGIIRAFDDAKKRGWVEAATDRGNLWRAILKATRVTTK